MTIKTCYIAGPMRGYPLYNFPAFDEAAESLREAGWKVVSPADLDRDNGFDPEIGEGPVPPLDDCIKRDLKAVLECDAIVLLPGWEKSTGAKAEYEVAKWAGKPGILYPSMLPAEPPKVEGLPDTGARTQFATGAVRDAMAGKGFPSDIPPCAINRLAQLYEKGAEKYARGNWRGGIPLSRYYDAIFRHTMKAGQGLDDEDHLAAVLWNAAGWMWTLDQIKAGKLPADLNDLQYWEGDK